MSRPGLPVPALEQAVPPVIRDNDPSPRDGVQGNRIPGPQGQDGDGDGARDDGADLEDQVVQAAIAAALEAVRRMREDGLDPDQPGRRRPREPRLTAPFQPSALLATEVGFGFDGFAGEARARGAGVFPFNRAVEAYERQLDFLTRRPPFLSLFA